ncbi:Sin3-associated polypeptide SAP18 [Toxoplasma gondii VEG]|uniref:Sap18 (Sin3 associated polypeptide p18),putative n=1 Tax=Toxoplasma gondii (strain ATCC 50861 / VEG) TaxID=432359 RepID=V4ZG90_TOXGV|nr:Sin3-associated polypeptide SAP18 [Toxoplasma gondii VEG]CEL73964.1 TPA: sap18 (Sin3 associated polypeptide p18),putative [Toxoplasma gondii VEG]
MARHRSRSPRKEGDNGEERRMSRSASSRRRRSPSPRVSKRKTSGASASNKRRAEKEKRSRSTSSRRHRSKQRRTEKRASASPRPGSEGAENALQKKEKSKASFRAVAPPKGLSSRSGRHRTSSRSPEDKVRDGVKDATHKPWLRKSEEDEKPKKARRAATPRASPRRELSRSPSPGDAVGSRRKPSRSGKSRTKANKGGSESPRRERSRSHSRLRTDKKEARRESPEGRRPRRRRRRGAHSPRRSLSPSRSRSLRLPRPSPSIQREPRRNPRSRGGGGRSNRRHSKSRSVSRSRSDFSPYPNWRFLPGRNGARHASPHGPGAMDSRRGRSANEEFLAALPPDHPFASRMPPKHSTTPLLPPLSRTPAELRRGLHPLFDPRSGPGAFWGSGDRGRPTGADRGGPNDRWARGEELRDDLLGGGAFGRRDAWTERGRPGSSAMPRGSSPPPSFFQERLMMRRKLVQDAEMAGIMKERRRALRRTLKPALMVDRCTTPPFLLRVFYKVDDQHSFEQFQQRGREPVEDELQVYAWMDSKLREIAYLVKDVCWEARDRHAVWKFRLVYPDKTGKNVIADIGLLHSTIPDLKEDSKTLADVKFQIGDFLLLSIVKEKKDTDHVSRAGQQRMRTTAGGWEKVVQEEPEGVKSVVGDSSGDREAEEEAASISLDKGGDETPVEEKQKSGGSATDDVTPQEGDDKKKDGEGEPEAFPYRQRYTAPDQHTDDEDDPEERKDHGAASILAEEDGMRAVHGEASTRAVESCEGIQTDSKEGVEAVSSVENTANRDVSRPVEKESASEVGSSSAHSASPERDVIPKLPDATGHASDEEQGQESGRGVAQRDEKEREKEGERRDAPMERRRSARLGKRKGPDA